VRWGRRCIRGAAATLAVSALVLAPGPVAATPSPDPTFGTGGIVDGGPGARWTDAVELPGGDLVVVGTTGSGAAEQGTFDLVDPVGAGVVPSHPRVVVTRPGLAIGLEHVERGPRGTVVAFGRFDGNGTSGAAIARVVIGSMGLDRTFGRGGLLTLALPRGTDCSDGDGTLLPDGRLLVRCTNSTGSRLVLAEVDSVGRPVPSFGIGGVAVVPLPALASGRSGRLALLPDGRIVAALGWANGAVGALRLLGSGVVDRSFGGTGFASRRPFGVIARMGASVVVDASGGIVVAAGVSVHGYSDEFDDDVAVVRFLPNGSPDRSFAAGRSYARLAMMDVQRLVRLPDGSLLVAGGSSLWRADGISTSETRVARLSATGTPLTTFGPQTPSTLQPPGTTQSGLSGVVVGHGALTLVGGRLTSPDPLSPDWHAVLVRYTPFRFSPRPVRFSVSAPYAQGPFRACGGWVATACHVSGTAYLMGSLWPLLNDPSGDVTLQAERRSSSGRWVRLLTPTGWAPPVWTSDHGSLRASPAITTHGVFRLRVVVAPSTSTLASASPWVYIRH